MGNGAAAGVGTADEAELGTFLGVNAELGAGGGASCGDHRESMTCWSLLKSSRTLISNVKYHRKALPVKQTEAASTSQSLSRSLPAFRASSLSCRINFSHLSVSVASNMRRNSSAVRQRSDAARLQSYHPANTMPGRQCLPRPNESVEYLLRHDLYQETDYLN